MDRVNPGLRDNRASNLPEGAAGGHFALDEEQASWEQLIQAATPEAFCQSWLALQCRMIPGVSGGLLVLGTADDGSSFAPVASWPEGRRNLKELVEAAQQALIARHRLLLQHKPQGNSGAPSGGREYLAQPIQVEGRLHGAVALEIAPCPDEQLQASVLRPLQWGSAWIEVLLRRQDGTKNGATGDRLQAALDLVATAVGHERFYAVATAFVTGMATRLGCDRVSVGFVRGRRVRIRALSHSAQFKKETNLIRAIGSAMDEAFDQGAAVVYPAPSEGPIRVTRAHAELARRYGAGAICSIPMSDGSRIFGVMTLERPADCPFDAQTIALCEAVAALAGPMLETQRREDRWLVVKAAEACRKQLAHLVGPRHVAFKLSITALAGLIAFFVLARGDYRVTARATLEPTIQRAVVAPFDGYIAEARARAGDLLRRGQVLCMLDDRDLMLERLKWLSQHEQLVKQYDQALGNGDAARLAILTAQIDQAKAQLALTEDRLSRIRLRAPFDGFVVLGDLSQSLSSPVERGQVLFEMAPLDAYRVVLQVDEREVADVAVGKRGRLALSAAPTDPLSFVVEKITPISTAQEGRNYFRVEAWLQSRPSSCAPAWKAWARSRSISGG